MSFALRSRFTDVQPGERTISANLSKAIAAIRRRTRISAALRVGVPAGAGAAFAWIALRLAVAASLAPAGWLLPAALAFAGVVAAAALVRAALVPVPAASAVRELDRRAGARGRVIAAHELSASADPFAKAAIDDAASAVVDACSCLARLFPIGRPAQTSRAIALLTLAPLSALALDGVSFSLHGRGNASREATDVEVASTARTPLPTLAWVMKETSSLLAPLALPRATPTPVAIATPVPVPTRGASITDPEKRAYFDKVLENATDQTVSQQVIERFTKELLSKQYEVLVAEFQSRSTSSGAQYNIGGDKNAVNKGLPPEMAKGGGGGGGMGPAIDPSKIKSEYLKDENDQESELLGAIKENFDIYLKEFAKEMLKGMEEALEKALSEPALNGNDNVASSHLKGLPNVPGGLADGHEPGPAPGEGPMYSMKEGGGTPTAEGASSMQQALGGTAAGGSGAGAGNEGQGSTAGGKSDGKATGERVDLGGTLDERLAVVDVVQRMSGGVSEVDDTAAAEVVRKSTKAAEAEAAGAEEIPEEYRGAVEAYFRALTPGN